MIIPIYSVILKTGILKDHIGIFIKEEIIRLKTYVEYCVGKLV